MNMREIEEQRYGRNKDTAINHTYIDSGHYRNKFDCISDNPDLNRLLYRLAKVMLKHRSGTLLEDMYWIDLESTKVVAQEVNSAEESKIIYSNNTQKIIEQYDNLLTIHSHPNSSPPSISDINSNFENGYHTGIIVGHNGIIYMYRANEEISDTYYQLVVSEYLNDGYNESEAQKLAWQDIVKNFDVLVKEVTDNDV